MALSAAEKQRVINMLDEMDKSRLQKVLASVEAFGNWLSNVAYSIYSQVRGSLRSLWKAIRSLF